MSTLKKRALLIGGFTVVIAIASVCALEAVHAQNATNVETNHVYQEPSAAPVTTVDKTGALSVVQALSATFEQVVSKASPAVVHIQIEKGVKESPVEFFGPNNGAGDPQGLFRFFFGPGMGQRGVPGPSSPSVGPIPVGQGSGFIISSDGYIITNNHIVDGADRLKVSLTDGRELTAKLIGTDPETEIALIKVDAQGLSPLPLGNSDDLRVGEWVLAIGSPFGLDHSVTSGIVSARGRGNVGIVDYADFIQTDAAINPGNSGGPLLDMSGNVVGMNTAIVSSNGGSNGVGFAIPVNMIKYITDQLLNNGKITRGFLGISIQEMTPELAKWFNVTEGHGILVAEVSKDSPAEKAGLQRDDVIVEYNGRPVGEVGAFRSHIATTASGSTVNLTIVRNGQHMTKTIQIGSISTEQVAMNSDSNYEDVQTDLGITVQGLTDDLAQRLGYQGEKGVVVAQVAPASKAERAGIKAGDLIKEVNKKEVDNPKDFKQALKYGDKNQSMLLLVQEGQASRYIALETA